MNPISWREQITVHPAADLFPMMPDDELDELAADIEKHGLRQAIDFQGDELLDGRNRLAAIHRIKDESAVTICSASLPRRNGSWKCATRPHTSSQPISIVGTLAGN
jgi:hypothetical protein